MPLFRGGGCFYLLSRGRGMRWAVATALAVIAWPVEAADKWTPGDALSAAAKDVVTLPAESGLHARYFSIGHLDAKQRIEIGKVLNAHVHGLSREADITPLAVIAGSDGALLRLDVRDYGWGAKVWEKLADVEPYFHVTLATVEEEFEEVEETVEYGFWVDDRGRRFNERAPGRTWQKTRDVPTGKKIRRVKETKRDKVRASYAATPQEEAALASLIRTTQSQVPLVRGDWFLVHTAAQSARQGSGYYDFLGIKKRGDIDELIGLDRDKARKIQKEMAAIVAESGVAINNRQIVRFQAIAGSYWQTLDSETSVGNRNALRLLDGDFKHDAEEIYFTLPNGLFGLAASAADGSLQETVPDKIASDSFASGHDARIHPGISCIRCHVGGLQPINDWARTFYSKDATGAIIELTSPDYDKAKRLKRLYLSDLPGQLGRDNQDYARSLFAVNGLKPEANAKGFSNVWKQYLDTPVTGDVLARELGVDKAVMLEAFKRQQKGAADPILLGFVRVPEYKAKREHVEEAFGVAMQLVYGVKP